jgi:hypothetical protein
VENTEEHVIKIPYSVVGTSYLFIIEKNTSRVRYVEEPTRRFVARFVVVFVGGFVVGFIVGFVAAFVA